MAVGCMASRVSPVAACVLVALLLTPASDVLARTQTHAKPGAATLTADAIENAQWSAESHRGPTSPIVLKAEVLLDRAGFSPGEIDGHDGENFRKALRAYQDRNELNPSGKLDQATWNALVNTSDQT